MKDDLRYPIGGFQWTGSFTPEEREACIKVIEETPAKLADAVKGLSDAQLDTPYREGGWTVRQVAHHLADAHMTSLTRFKHALTETVPVIKPFDEGTWAQLPDTLHAPVEMALDMVRGIHKRWAYLLRHMTEDDFAKTFFHPGSGQIMSLDRTLAFYSWHSRHHIAHITNLRQRMGW